MTGPWLAAGPPSPPALPIPVLAGRDYHVTLLRHSRPVPARQAGRNEAGQFLARCRGSAGAGALSLPRCWPIPPTGLRSTRPEPPASEKLLEQRGGEEVPTSATAGAEARGVELRHRGSGTGDAPDPAGRGRGQAGAERVAGGETNPGDPGQRRTGSIWCASVVTAPKVVRLSYSYIAFPGETQTHLWDDGALIQRDIGRRYAPLQHPAQLGRQRRAGTRVGQGQRRFMTRTGSSGTGGPLLRGLDPETRAGLLQPL